MQRALRRLHCALDLIAPSNFQPSRGAKEARANAVLADPGYAASNSVTPCCSLAAPILRASHPLLSPSQKCLL